MPVKTYRLNRKKDILAMFSFYFLHRTKIYCKKPGIPICFFDESRTQDKSRFIFYMNRFDLDES